MSELNSILEEAYRRAGIKLESDSAPVAPVDKPAGDPKGLTESQIQEFALARAGIPAKPEGS